MTTNYVNTFIQVAEDCPVEVAEAPASKGSSPTVAVLQHAMIEAHPYRYTSDDVLFEVYAQRQGIPEAERETARAAFFAKAQACLRASPLGKRHGWGIHHDEDGRVALVPLGSDAYRKFVAAEGVKQLKAMRSRRT